MHSSVLFLRVVYLFVREGGKVILISYTHVARAFGTQGTREIYSARERKFYTVFSVILSGL